MSTSLETQRELAELRQKGREGTMTLDDCRRAITILRAERLAMPQASAKPRTKAATPNANDLLAELGL